VGVRFAEKYRGALLGLAIGDALGTTLEFKPPGTFKPITDISGGGPFNLKPGEWTDDTTMALFLAESLVQWRGFDAKDQMDRYCRWQEEGYLSSNGRCFDISCVLALAMAKGTPLLPVNSA
jgi:ADP-ribosylglycohydrolase